MKDEGVYSTVLHSDDYKIFLVGVEFSRNEKNIVGFEWERLKNSFSKYAII